MNQLRDAMRDLADDVPPAVAAPDLWSKGVRRKRRVLALKVSGALTTLAVIAGISLSAPGVLTRSEPPPAGTQVQARLPDHVYAASGWTKGTDEVGPPGRIAVIVRSERQHLFGGSEDAFVAISALDGSYRVLEPPGLAPLEPAAALSPDGRYLAYPHRLHVKGLDEPLEAGVDAWRVYDAQTGEVRTVQVPDAAFGTAGTDVAAPTWTPDSRTLVIYRCVYNEEPANGGSSCSANDSQIWNVSTGESRIVPRLVLDDEVGSFGEQLLTRRGNRLFAVDSSTGAQEAVGRVDLSAYGTTTLLRLDGSTLTVAGAVKNSGTCCLLVDATGEGQLGGSASARRLDPAGTPVAAVSPGRVALLSSEGPQQILVHDVARPSQPTPVLTFESGVDALHALVATDLLGVPTRPAPHAPDEPTSPRVVSAFAAFGLLALAILGSAILRERRRRERRGLA